MCSAPTRNLAFDLIKICNDYFLTERTSSFSPKQETSGMNRSHKRQFARSPISQELKAITLGQVAARLENVLFQN